MKTLIIYFETLISKIDNDCHLRPSQKYKLHWRLHNRYRQC